MSKKGGKQQFSNLSYVAQTPSFLKNFGLGNPSGARSPPPSASTSSSNSANQTRAGREGGDGREPLPERPREGKWAEGSDDERGVRRAAGAGEDESDDEWGEEFGGGGDEGPQVVVLREGRHLTLDEIKKERQKAAGIDPSATEKRPDSSFTSTTTSTSKADKPKVQVPKAQNSHTSTNKRKLVGGAKETEDTGEKEKDKGGKKKKKATKGLLSFDEAEGE